MSEKIIVSDWSIRREHDSEIISGWTQKISSYDEIPHAFKNSFEKEDEFPYTIFIPEERGFFGVKSPATVMQLGSSSIRAAIRHGSGVTTKIIALSDFQYIEQGNNLLRCWANLISEDETISILFNMANIKLIKPVIDAVRKSYRKTAAPGTKNDTFEPFTFLQHKDYKLMYYGAHSLYPEDRVAATLYQQSVTLREFRILGKILFRKITNPRILVCTLDEIAIFSGNLDKDPQESTDYGGVYTFIPRRHIAGITREMSKEKNFDSVTVELKNGRKISSDVEKTNTHIDNFIAKSSL